MRRAVVLVAAALAACAQKPASGSLSKPGHAARLAPATDPRLPDFVRYEPFSRAAVVGIARREWRLFGSPVDDDYPDTRPPVPPDQKPERVEGLWQRVGEYWWFGLPESAREVAWTGKHDGTGAEFEARRDASFAWSAAFISYVMRMAGAAERFPYAAAHADYIDAAVRGDPGLAIAAERPSAYAPVPGDLICMARGRAAGMRFDDLPAAFPGHCDVVADAGPGQISVLGGNVDDAVTLKHVPVTPDGRLADPDGTVRDPRYPWLVVIRLTLPPPAGVVSRRGNAEVASR